MRRAFLLLIALAGLGLAALAAYRAASASWPHAPTRGAMLHRFGAPVSYQSCGFHTGQDWFAPEGTPVFAVEDGTVAYVGPLWFEGEGLGRGPYSIVLAHEDAEGAYYTTYGHNAAAHVAEGDAVRRGQVIADMGAEGYARGPHLHFEKVRAPYTGDWRRPFVGCDGYEDPGMRWAYW